MQKRGIASLKQNLEYINILQEFCKIETFTEIIIIIITRHFYSALYNNTIILSALHV
jgi:hypothetical protein